MKFESHTWGFDIVRGRRSGLGSWSLLTLVLVTVNIHSIRFEGNEVSLFQDAAPRKAWV